MAGCSSISLRPAAAVTATRRLGRQPAFESFYGADANLAAGRVPERPKGHASKACEVQASVGSNPTPSATTVKLEHRCGPKAEAVFLFPPLVRLLVGRC